jgi:hypothetical protein
MTVEGVMATLAKLDPKLRVVVNMGYNELANGKTAGKIEVIEAYRYKENDDVWKEVLFEKTPDTEIVYEQVVNISY